MLSRQRAHAPGSSHARSGSRHPRRGTGPRPPSAPRQRPSCQGKGRSWSARQYTSHAKGSTAADGCSRAPSRLASSRAVCGECSRCAALRSGRRRSPPWACPRTVSDPPGPPPRTAGRRSPSCCPSRTPESLAPAHRTASGFPLRSAGMAELGKPWATLNTPDAARTGALAQAARKSRTTGASASAGAWWNAPGTVRCSPHGRASATARAASWSSRVLASLERTSTGTRTAVRMPAGRVASPSSWWCRSGVCGRFSSGRPRPGSGGRPPRTPVAAR